MCPTTEKAKTKKVLFTPAYHPQLLQCHIVPSYSVNKGSIQNIPAFSVFGIAELMNSITQESCAPQRRINSWCIQCESSTSSSERKDFVANTPQKAWSCKAVRKSIEIRQWSYQVCAGNVSKTQISPPAGSHASRGEGGLDNSTKWFFGVW